METGRGDGDWKSRLFCLQRWVDEDRFGLEFLRIKQRDQVKVAHLIQRQRDETPISLL